MLISSCHSLGCGCCRQQDWIFAGYSTLDESMRAQSEGKAAAIAEVKDDNLAGRNVEIKWDGDDMWYRGQVCAQAPDRQGRRLVQCIVRPRFTPVTGAFVLSAEC